MRALTRKIPAVLLAAALLAVAAPAWPGGRDVPDRNSSGSSSAAKPDLLPRPDQPGDCPQPVVLSTVTVGGLSFDLVWTPEGGYSLAPSLWTAVLRVVGQGTSSEGSCPTD